MPTEVLASTLVDPSRLAYMLGYLLIPITGLVLLVVGLVMKSRGPKPPQLPMGPPPGYPPPPGWGPPPHQQVPQGFPPPPGQPGYPAPPTPQGYPQPWAATPPPPPRRKTPGAGLIIAGAVILGLSLIGGVARVADTSSQSSSSSRSTSSSSVILGQSQSRMGLKVGQCVSDEDFGTAGDQTPTDCSDPEATMEVVSVGGANALCPDGKDRTATDYTTLFSADETICFAANLVEGDCYAVDTSPQSSDAPFTHQDCADSRAKIKVVQRFDGQSSAPLCAADTKSVAYDQPARLYCIQPAHQ